MPTQKRLKKLDKKVRRNLEFLKIPEFKDIAICVKLRDQLREESSKVTEIYGYGREAQRVRVNSDVYFARSLGSIAAYYGTDNWLEYVSHRFVFGQEDTIYHREPFNVDHQALPSKTLNLVGITEIAENPYVVKELFWLSDQIDRIKSLNIYAPIQEIKVPSVKCEL